jgi:hypothetical protein
MRFLLVSTLLVAFAVPLAANAQSGGSALGGQATALRLTRAEALRAVEHAGYTGITKLALGPNGTWTALTSQGAVKVTVAGRVIHSK